VYSDAAKKLTTSAFAELSANPGIGRAEALRHSMVAMITSGEPYEHPAMWAPFVLVGEGGASTSAPVTTQTVTSPTPSPKGSARARTKPGAPKNSDWTTGIWR
jgi:hypothetical protein